MLDTNESTNAKINIQAQLDNIWQIGGAVALTEVAAALNAILAKLGVDAQSLSAAEREMCLKSGGDLHALSVQKAKNENRERVLATLSEDDLAASRLGGWDPLEYAVQKREAEGSLTALSHTTRVELSRQFKGNLVSMALAARRQGLLT